MPNKTTARSGVFEELAKISDSLKAEYRKIDIKRISFAKECKLQEKTTIKMKAKEFAEAVIKDNSKDGKQIKSLLLRMRSGGIEFENNVSEAMEAATYLKPLQDAGLVLGYPKEKYVSGGYGERGDPIIQVFELTTIGERVAAIVVYIEASKSRKAYGDQKDISIRR